MNGKRSDPTRAAHATRGGIGLSRDGSRRRLGPAPAALRRPTPAGSTAHALAAFDGAALAPSWLQPRFPLVHALIHELFRLERRRNFSDLYRPARVSRSRRRPARGGRDQ
jgi:hypothetical protein